MASVWDEFSFSDNSVTDNNVLDNKSESVWDKFQFDPLKEHSPVQKASKLEQIFDVPSAGVRGMLQGKGYGESVANFKDVPKFQDIFLDKYYQSNFLKDNPLMKGYLGQIPSAVGFAADIATNPAEGLISLAGGKGLEMMAKAGKSLGAPFKARALFGNQQKEMRKVAERALKGVDEAEKIINSRYTNEIGHAFKLPIPSKDFNSVTNSALKAINDAPDLGTSIPQFEKVFDSIANSKTLGDLHEVKSGIGRLMSSARSKPQRDALKQLYASLSDALKGNKTNIKGNKQFGEVYSSITKEFDKFANEIGNVVSSVSKRKYGSGRAMPTGSKLLSKSGKSNVMDIPEVKEAFKGLEGYFPHRLPFSTSGPGQNLIADINAINRADPIGLLKSASGVTGKVLTPGAIMYLLWKQSQGEKDRSDYSGNQGSN